MKKNGFSLVEVLVAGGIMGVIMMATMQMISNQTRETRGVSEKLSALSLDKVLLTSLADGTVCRYMVKDNTTQQLNRNQNTVDATDVASLKNSVIKFNYIPVVVPTTGAPVKAVEAGEVASENSIGLLLSEFADSPSGIELTDFVSVSDQSTVLPPYFAKLKINFHPTKTIRPHKPLVYPVIVRATGGANGAATVIDDCASLAQVGTATSAWVRFDGTKNVTNSGASTVGNPVYIYGSFNVSSVVKTAPGEFTVNFTQAFPNTSYAVTTGIGDGNPPSWLMVTVPTHDPAFVEIVTKHWPNNNTDVRDVNVAISTIGFAESGGGGLTSCPAGMNMVGDPGKHATYCIDANERGAQFYPDAVDTCYAVNDTTAGRAHVCDYSEWNTACRKGLANNMTGNWEWVSVPHTSGGQNWIGLIGNSGCFDTDIDGLAGAPHGFRCCIP